MKKKEETSEKKEDCVQTDQKPDEKQESFGTEHEQFLRLQAEFANYKKRVEKEKQDVRAQANTRLLKDIVVLRNELEKALCLGDEDQGGLRKGIDMLGKKMDLLLKNEGVALIIPEKGKPVDISIHEIAACIEAENTGPMRIMEIIRNGFMVNGKVAEPALVVVSTQKKEENKKENEEN